MNGLENHVDDYGWLMGDDVDEVGECVMMMMMQSMTIMVMLGLITCDIVAQYARSDDAPVWAEEGLQFLLSHLLWQAAHIQICTFDRFAAWTRE